MQCKDRPDFRCWLFNEKEEDPIRLFETCKVRHILHLVTKDQGQNQLLQKSLQKKKFKALDLNWTISGNFIRVAHRYASGDYKISVFYDFPKTRPKKSSWATK